MLYIALLHHPVYNKNKGIITTCITGFDLHDIARSGLTYNIKKYFVINPLKSQRDLAKRVIRAWSDKKAHDHNWTRFEALKVLSVKRDLGSSIKQIIKETGMDPVLIATSAREKSNLSYKQLRTKLKNERKPILLLFGTGWGITDKFLEEKVDYVLNPIRGTGEYNHLSVRSAAAVILDRLFGR
jgi:hypothetical protein